MASQHDETEHDDMQSPTQTKRKLNEFNKENWVRYDEFENGFVKLV